MLEKDAILEAGLLLLPESEVNVVHPFVECFSGKLHENLYKVAVKIADFYPLFLSIYVIIYH